MDLTQAHSKRRVKKMQFPLFVACEESANKLLQKKMTTGPAGEKKDKPEPVKVL